MKTTPGNCSQVVSKEGIGEGENKVMARIEKAKGETTHTEKVGKDSHEVDRGTQSTRGTEGSSVLR
jgi:hypothetical protein